VHPLLVERCYKCHSHQHKIEGGLALDSRSGWEQGGDSGPALVPGAPEKSRLITAVGHSDPDLKMPADRQAGPRKKIALLVRMGPARSARSAPGHRSGRSADRWPDWGSDLFRTGWAGGVCSRVSIIAAAGGERDPVAAQRVDAFILASS